MNTTRNRAMVLAHFLRAATAVIRQTDAEAAMPNAPVSDEEYQEALASIDAVADELEIVARTPAPASSTVINASEKL